MKPMNSDQFARLADHLPGAAFLYEIRGDGSEAVRFLNKGCEDLWGVTAAEVERDMAVLWAMIHPDDLEAMGESVRLSAETMSQWEHRFRVVNAEGAERHVIGHGAPSATTSGGVTWVSFLFDITAQTQTKALFEQVTQQLDYVSSAIPDGFALFDAEERLIVCNELFRSYYGLDPGRSLKGLAYQTVLSRAVETGDFPDARGREAEWMQTALERFRAADSFFQERRGAERWFKTFDRPTEDGGRVSFRLDTTETVKRNHALHMAASTDTLTGLANRRGLSEWIDARAQSMGSDKRLVFFHIDLDRFKSINDIQGHDAGDQVLRTAAQRLTEHMVIEPSLAARVGGDEFVVAAKTNLSDDEVMATADRFRHDITEPVEIENGYCQVGASVGISIWSQEGETSVEQALLDADTALLTSKDRGRNQCALFSSEMRDIALKRAELAAQLREGLARGEIVPFFQPQVHWPSGTVSGLETLARWVKSDGTIVSASGFIDVANEAGLVSAIDDLMLSGILDILQRLEPIIPEPPKASINLSCAQLQDRHVVENLLDQLMEKGISPRQINVEVLESTLLDQRSSLVASNIKALAKAGFSIELDDFGTGHTALASLTSFPVDRIKVDRSLITNIHNDSAKQAVTEGIFSLCERLGISAIAEGVETENERDVLCEMGFTLFQGYLFAKPMSAAALLEWIAAPAAQKALG